MKNLQEYLSTTPASELYHFLAEILADEQVTSFSGLLEYTKALPLDARTSAVYIRLFKLIRKLHWGFFRDIDPETYPKVWREVVIPHPHFKQCGDLKRNLTISDVYVGILDLHGYTRFCEKNKNNLSMLQMLDDMIQVDVVKLAREHNTVLQRRQGDEMVLVGASAADLIAVSLRIINYFSKSRSINFKSDTGQRSGYKIILEEMHISAGIAGGKKFTPFIITRDGDLSGGVVNTAARLQGRANELSGEKSCILVTRTVASSFSLEMKNGMTGIFRDIPLHFFDSGWISFKGIAVAVSEVIFDATEHYRLEYEKDMLDLYKAADGAVWKDGLFNGLILLLIRVLKNMHKFKLEALSNGLSATLTNDDLIRLAQEALNKFRVEQDYATAIENLNCLIEYVRDIPSFDRLCLEYAERILDQYRDLSEVFNARLEMRLQEKAGTVLSAKYKQLYEESKKSVQVQERLRDHLKKSFTPLELSLLWSSVVDERQSRLSVSIHSGKR